MKMKTETLDRIKFALKVLSRLLGAAFFTGIVWLLPVLSFGMFNREYISLMENSNNVFYLLNIVFVILAIVILHFRYFGLIFRILGADPPKSSAPSFITFLIIIPFSLAFSIIFSKAIAISISLTDQQTIDILIPIYIFVVVVAYVFEIIIYSFKEERKRKNRLEVNSGT